MDILDKQSLLFLITYSLQIASTHTLSNNIKRLEKVFTILYCISVKGVVPSFLELSQNTGNLTLIAFYFYGTT